MSMRSNKTIGKGTKSKWIQLKGYKTLKACQSRHVMNHYGRSFHS